MKIHCSNPGTRWLGLPNKFGRLRVEFAKNGNATVPDDVGQYLVSKCPTIEEVVAPTRKAKRVSTEEGE